MADRYVHLNENLYFDTKDRVIVKNMGNRYVFVRHDRRVKNEAATAEKRREEKAVKDMLFVSKGLYFDKKLKQLYKKSGGKLVLYSKDRRKTSKPVPSERRKEK